MIIIIETPSCTCMCTLQSGARLHAMAAGWQIRDQQPVAPVAWGTDALRLVTSYLQIK
jgi:hypothetical protein